MKKIKLFSLSLLVCLSVWSQNDKQAILDNTVSLPDMFGVEYQRIVLSAEDFRMADSLVNLYLQANYRHYDWTRKIDNYYDYFRQYAGYREGSSRTFIFINAYRYKKAAGDLNPEKQLISNKGGGADFFCIKLDLLKKECFDLHVNTTK